MATQQSPNCRSDDRIEPLNTHLPLYLLRRSFGGSGPRVEADSGSAGAVRPGRRSFIATSSTGLARAHATAQRACPPNSRETRYDRVERWRMDAKE
jgi:hypothetical protein